MSGAEPDPLSRRIALFRLAAGGIAGGLAVRSLETARAQKPPAAVDATVDVLLVQRFGAGVLAPAAASTADYTLTLRGGVGHTLFFSDRPERIAGITTTSDVLAALGVADPPNAALVLDVTGGSGAGEADPAWVVALLDATLDAGADALTYRAQILYAANGAVPTGGAPPPAPRETRRFGAGYLFIDGIHTVPIDDLTGKTAHFPVNNRIRVVP